MNPNNHKLHHTISYSSGSSEQPLLGLTIGQLFDQTVEKFPDNEALVVVHQQIRWTYQELKEKVDTAAKALLAIGLKKGDRVGVWAPNCAEWTIIQFASAKIGAILVNINPGYRLHELKYALNQSGCKVVVTADKFKYSDYTAIWKELIPDLHTFQAGEIKSAEVPDLTTLIRIGEKEENGMWNWPDWLKFAEKKETNDLINAAQFIDFDDPINIQYTSGTTGFPKGALLSHHNIVNNAFFVGMQLGYTPADRVIIPVPLYHCFGMVLGNLGCLTHGATMIYASEGFDPEAVLQTAEAEKATSLYGVPTMFIAELEHPNFKQYNLQSLRTGLMAGASCPVEIMRKVKNDMHMTGVQIAYGMTETSPVSTQTRPGTPIEKQVSTVGQVHPHLEIKIINPENGRIVPIHTPGELCTRGYSVMIGYWNDAEKTKEAIDNDGWIHSGDLATMDEEGYINIVGRIKEMIIRGGENIYPREIEEFLLTNDKIADVQVIGIPDEKYGEVVMAWVQLHEGITATADELKDFCKGKIAHFKIPQFFKFVESFPLTITGKVRKIEMQEISIQELGRQKAASTQMA